MNKELLVICPTRERPDQCRKLIKSVDKMSSKHVKLLFIVDSDDICANEYQHIFTVAGHESIIRYSDTLTEMHNLIVTQIYPDFDYYSITCDDFIYHTDDWDQILIKKLKAKGGGFAYGDDGMNGALLPTTCVISASIIKALGWITLPGLKHLCADLVWRELGQQLNRLFYIPEVKIEHMTSLIGKAEEDDTFRRTNSDENYTNDNKTFRTWRSNQMLADVGRIRKALDG